MLTTLYLDYLCAKPYKVIIHCAAGIHRTGTCAYSLMRMDGNNRNEAY